MSRGLEECDRERAAFSSLVEEVTSSDQPVDAEAIWNAVAGELTAEETGRLLDLASHSAEVAEAWRLARELQAIDAAPARDETVAGHRRWPVRAAYWAAIAAAVFLAVGLWPGPRDSPVPKPPTYRATEGQGLTSLLDEGIALPRESFLLRWTPAQGDGWRYEVRVTTENLEELAHTRDLVDPEYLVSPDALAACQRGSRLYWRVEAEHVDGRKKASTTLIVSIQ